MIEIFNRFSLHAAKFDYQVWVCLFGIWLIVLATTIASINSQKLTPKKRQFWIVIVCALPIFGTLAYLPYSCHWAHLAELLFMKVSPSREKLAAASPKPIQAKELNPPDPDN